MSGLPGAGVNNPEGFVDLTDPAQPHTINVASIVGNVSIPLSVFPFWRNDGGIRSYGGVKYLSLFEDGVTEGTSTSDVLAITQQPIEQVGTFTLVDPDAQKIYAIRIRLRSAQNDPNYKDFVITFRVVSPLEVPIQFEIYDDIALPEISFDAGLSQFTFDVTPPSTEIRIRSDGDGIVLPTTTSPFGTEATTWLLGHLQRQRDGIFIVDFLRSGAVEATARVVYAYKWTGAAYTIVKFRRKDFPDWNQYSGTDFGLAVANISVFDSPVAELQFTKNLYGTGPRFDSAIAVGSKGFLNIPPASIVLGNKIDIAPIVDFSQEKFLRRLGHDEQYITLIGITDTQIVVRQVPVWDRAISLYAVGGQQAIADLNAAPTYLFNSRVPLWPFVAFPNFQDFYDPAPAAPAAYPHLANIKLIDASGVTQQTWATHIILWDEMVSLRLPDQGTSIPVLDVRSYLSAVDSFYVLEYDVEVDVTGTNDYSIKSTFPINADGEPLMWERPDLDVIEELPTFVFDNWGILSITTPAVWNGSAFTILGDITDNTYALQPAATTTDYDLAGTIMSREADYVLVQWTNGGNMVSLRVPSTVQVLQLQGSDTIEAFFDGNTIMFLPGGLAGVAISSGRKDVTLKGDVGTLTLYDVAESVVYRLGLWGKGSQLFANPATPSLDIHFNGVTNRSAIRVANTYYEYREQGRANGTLAIANRGGPTTHGLKSSAYAFSMPRMKFLSETSEIEFENDGSNATYQTSQVVFINAVTGVKTSIVGTLVLGITYQLGDAGRSLVLGDFIVVSAAHHNGYTMTVMYKLTAAYSPALKVTPEGYL